MAMRNRAAVVVSVSCTAAQIAGPVSEPLDQAMTMEAKAPTAPASVAVNRPTNMPPITTISRARTGQVSFRWAMRSASGGRVESRGAQAGSIAARIQMTAM